MIEPGSGRPHDPATRATPVAREAGDVRRLADSAPSLEHLDARVSVCRACPRLVEWREQVATDKRAAFADVEYWGRPVTGFGPQRARIAIVGLAPAAHGGNRTGRVFTGDRSGDWLFAALHRAGLAERATSTAPDDGQRLIDTRILAVVRCAPPANKPTPIERDTCQPWLERELGFLAPTLRVVVALGGFAWQSLRPALAAVGYPLPARRSAFGHGVEQRLGDDGPLLLGCYHPSQQNTFTGRLTAGMIDAVFARATEAAGGRPAAVIPV
ncbi:MAG TPA: uracil-DNA glycosylase [Mycobacteriales bacterium]|nr:uracil-DNA glycosylase [Mycobacteriales bacterium]